MLTDPLTKANGERTVMTTFFGLVSFIGVCLMRVSVFSTIVIGVTLILTFALQSPASAGPGCGGSLHPCSTAEWNAGSKSGAPKWSDGAHWTEQVLSYRKCGVDAKAVIREEGDWVYVMDTCADGRSAVGYWQMTHSKRHGYCRNKRGAGKWVRCNKNWPEKRMTLMAGVYNGSTGYLEVNVGGGVYFWNDH